MVMLILVLLLLQVFIASASSKGFYRATRISNTFHHYMRLQILCGLSHIFCLDTIFCGWKHHKRLTILSLFFLNLSRIRKSVSLCTPTNRILLLFGEFHFPRFLKLNIFFNANFFGLSYVRYMWIHVWTCQGLYCKPCGLWVIPTIRNSTQFFGGPLNQEITRLGHERGWGDPVTPWPHCFKKPVQLF